MYHLYQILNHMSIWTKFAWNLLTSGLFLLSLPLSQSSGILITKSLNLFMKTKSLSNYYQQTKYEVLVFKGVILFIKSTGTLKYLVDALPLLERGQWLTFWIDSAKFSGSLHSVWFSWLSFKQTFSSKSCGKLV